MNKYKVRMVSRKRAEWVEADYFKVDNGILTFRMNSCRGKDGYPVMVKTYAPGTWESIENVAAMDLYEVGF